MNTAARRNHFRQEMASETKSYVESAVAIHCWQKKRRECEQTARRR